MKVLVEDGEQRREHRSPWKSLSSPKIQVVHGMHQERFTAKTQSKVRARAQNAGVPELRRYLSPDVRMSAWQRCVVPVPEI